MFRKASIDRHAICPIDGPPPPGREPFVVTVPGVDAPIFRLDLPPRLRGSARLRVARRELSDKLDVPERDLDLIPVPTRGPTPWQAVICVDAAKRETWVGGQLAKARRTQAVLPEYLALPVDEGTMTAFSQEDTIHVRLGLDDGFSAPAVLATHLLRAGMEAHDLKAAVLLGDFSQDFLNVVKEAGLSISDSADSADGFTRQELGLDLRRAEAASSLGIRKSLRLWIISFLAALAAFCVWCASVMLETRILERDTTAVRQATVALLREGLLPNDPILDIRQQVIQRLEDASGSRDPSQGWALDHLSLLSVALFGKGARVQSISFDPARGHSAVVYTSGFAGAEELVATLKDSGLEVRDSSIRQLDGENAELRFRVPAPVEGESR